MVSIARFTFSRRYLKKVAAIRNLKQSQKKQTNFKFYFYCYSFHNENNFFLSCFLSQFAFMMWLAAVYQPVYASTTNETQIVGE